MSGLGPSLMLGSATFFGSGRSALSESLLLGGTVLAPRLPRRPPKDRAPLVLRGVGPAAMGCSSDSLDLGSSGGTVGLGTVPRDPRRYLGFRPVTCFVSSSVFERRGERLLPAVFRRVAFSFGSPPSSLSPPPRPRPWTPRRHQPW